MELAAIPAKTIVTRVKGGGGWFGVDYNMNLYRGCCHGCIYCDSRSDCYGNGEFDRVRVKENALAIVRDELRRKAAPGVVGTGSMSDPYNPFEREYEYTRHGLELLGAYGFGVAVATKSDLIVRDIDLFLELKEQAPVLCKITITTTDDDLAAKVEPGAPSPSRRFAAIEKLSAAGICCGVLLMPVLPFIEDSEANVLDVARRASRCGARFVYPAFGMTMRAGQREWYLARLEENFPGRGLREQYERHYGSRYQCTSPAARRLWAAFAAECGQLGLLYRMEEIIRAYKDSYGSRQLRLF